MFRHGATYAGHPSVCAAALATIDIYESEDIIRRGQDLEQPLYDALAPLADHPAASEVRGGTGFLAAVGVNDPAAVATLAAGARKAGVLVRPLLGGVAVSPPLICEQEHIDLLAQAIKAGLDAVAAG
jgi:putrescine---pyruvate transaminase